MKHSSANDKEFKMLRAARLEGRKHGLEIEEIQLHCNGVEGVAFTAVLFRDQEDPGARKVAVLFDQAHHTAVLDPARAAAGSVGRGNRWRGDTYDAALRSVLRAWSTAERDYRALRKRERALRVYGPRSRSSDLEADALIRGNPVA